MPRFRVWLVGPGKEKPLQAMCASLDQAKYTLKLWLDAGQPEGSTYGIYETKEFVVTEGKV